jgi:hypothetical protein
LSHHAGERQIKAEVEMATPLVVPIDWTRFTAGLPDTSMPDARSRITELDGSTVLAYILQEQYGRA